MWCKNKEKRVIYTMVIYNFKIKMIRYIYKIKKLNDKISLSY